MVRETTSVYDLCDVNLTYLGFQALYDVGCSLILCHAFDKIDIRFMRWIVGISDDSTWYGISGFGESDADMTNACQVVAK
jgi:hypothetical protein